MVIIKGERSMNFLHINTGTTSRSRRFEPIIIEQDDDESFLHQCSDKHCCWTNAVVYEKDMPTFREYARIMDLDHDNIAGIYGHALRSDMRPPWTRTSEEKCYSLAQWASVRRPLPEITWFVRSLNINCFVFSLVPNGDPTRFCFPTEGWNDQVLIEWMEELVRGVKRHDLV